MMEVEMQSIDNNNNNHHQERRNPFPVQDEDESGVPRKKFEPDIPQFNFTPEEYEKYERIFWHSEFRKLLEVGDYDGALLRRKMLERSGFDSSSSSRSNQSEQSEEDEADRWSHVENSSRSCSSERRIDSEMELEDFDYEEGYYPGTNYRAGKYNHPLLIPEIIEHILSFLSCHNDRDTLENCSDVCVQWSQAVKDKLEHFANTDEAFKISSKLSKMGILENKEELLKVIPKYCHWFNLNLPPKKPVPMEKVFKNLGSKMKELDVSFKMVNKNTLASVKSQPKTKAKTTNTAAAATASVNNNEKENEMDMELEMERLGDYIEEFCPNLEVLKLSKSAPADVPESFFSHSEKNRHHFLPLKQIETRDFTEWDDARSRIFPQLISSSPLLESLSFEHESTELIVHILSLLAAQNTAQSNTGKTTGTAAIFENGLSHLKSLEITHSDMSEEFIIFALKHRWSLKHLKIGFAPSVSIFKIRAFLTHLRYSLTSLSLLYKGKEEYESAVPIADNWVIPLSLRELKHLEISPDVYPNACRFLVNALQLPNIKTLKFDSTISWDDQYFHAMWNNQNAAVDAPLNLSMGPGPGRRSRSRSFSSGMRRTAASRRQRGASVEQCPWKYEEPTLEVLHLSCGAMDASIFNQTPNPFRNLKELKLSCPSIKVIQAIFLRLDNLERLEIDELYETSHCTWGDLLTRKDSKDIMPVDMKRRPIVWDEVLTFLKKPEYTLMYRMKAEPLKETQEIPSIRNLRNLKFLQLGFKKMPHYEKLTDFVIYHGLVYLKQLQHIKINRHDFSEEAIDYLRKNICQFAHLDFGTEDLELEAEPDFLKDVEV